MKNPECAGGAPTRLSHASWHTQGGEGWGGGRQARWASPELRETDRAVSPFKGTLLFPPGVPACSGGSIWRAQAPRASCRAGKHRVTGAGDCPSQE